MIYKAGYPTSYIDAGDLKPLTFGETYEFGVVVPSNELLDYLKMVETDSAKLFFTRYLDIYDEDGNISEEKIKLLDIRKEFKEVFDIHVENGVPKFASINVFSVLEHISRKVVKFMNIKSIGFVNHNKILEKRLKKTVLTGLETEDNKSFRLVVFQPYHIYMIAPVVNNVPGLDIGFSLSSLATAKISFKALYRRLSIYFPEKVVEFLSVAGWKRKEAITDFEEYEKALGSDVWMFKKGEPRFSLASKKNPEEDFVETLTFYYFHADFLKEASETRYNYVRELERFLSSLD